MRHRCRWRQKEEKNANEAAKIKKKNKKFNTKTLATHFAEEEERAKKEVMTMTTMRKQ